MSKIKEMLAKPFAPVLYFYNRLVATFLRAEDRQRRVYQTKMENLDEDSFLGKVQLAYWRVNSFFTREKFTLKEQKDLAEVIRMSVKFGNDNILPFRQMAKRTDLRKFVRDSCQEIAETMEDVSLYDIPILQKVFHREYIALIKVAYRTGNFVKTYDKIIASLDEKIKRRNALILIMLVPIFTLIVGVACEIFTSLFIIPEIIDMVDDVEQLPSVTASYYNLREILLNKKVEFGIYSLIAVGAIVLFFSLQGTRYLMSAFYMQMPFINKLIARWEISKFFNCINDLVKAQASMQEATSNSLSVINNHMIRFSLSNDIYSKNTQTTQLSEMLEDSVFIEQKIRNQLKIATMLESSESDLLDSIVEEYKESMKILLEAPAKVVMPFTLLLGALYIFLRLVPLFNEVNIMLQNIGT